MPTPLVDVVDGLGPDLVQVVAAASGLDVDVHRILIHDAADQQSIRRTDLVLGVGLADPRQAERVLRRRPGALLLKVDGSLDASLTTTSVRQDVVLLATPASTDWALLHQAIAQLPPRSSVQSSPPLAPTQLVQDLFDLANGLAAALKAPVTIEDNQSRLLAYSALQSGVDDARSATILGHRVPDAYRKEVRRLGVTRRLLTEIEPFHVTPKLAGVRPRVVVALRAHGEVLGSVWVMTDKPLRPKELKLLADGAREVSARLLHQRVLRDLRMNAEAGVLDVILRGGPAAADAARRTGLHPGPHRLLALSRHETPDGDQRLIQACATTMATQIAMAGVPARAAAIDAVAYVVFAAGVADDDRAMCQQAFDGMLRSLDISVRQDVVAGLSAAAGSLEGLPGARAEALDILRALRLPSSDAALAETDDVAAGLSLIHLAERRLAGLSRPPAVLERIARHDATHGTSYVDTVCEHLMAFADPSATSRALAVHVNTLRYRLRRIRELFDLDLDDNSTRFALLLELRLTQTAQSLSAPTHPRSGGSPAQWDDAAASSRAGASAADS